MVMLNRNRDLLMRAVEQINADKKYKMIMNASALIDADSTLDITATVLEVVNKLYAEEKEAK
jgi:outer membrane protein